MGTNEKHKRKLFIISQVSVNKTDIISIPLIYLVVLHETQLKSRLGCSDGL